MWSSSKTQAEADATSTATAAPAANSPAPAAVPVGRAASPALAAVPAASSGVRAACRVVPDVFRASAAAPATANPLRPRDSSIRVDAPGIGFAIPSNTVRNIANQLIKNGKVTNSDRASLGITAQTAANEQGQDGGVAIVGVQPGGAAAKAGLKPGDIIIAVNGQSTPSLQVLESAVAMLKPGTTVTLTVVRNGSTSDVKATLGTLSS